MTDLWPKLEPLLSEVEKPTRYINSEFNAPHYDESVPCRCSVVLGYPDTYEIGQSNNALAILGSVLTGLPGVRAERTFLPWTDLADKMRDGGLPLFSLESCAPVGDFDVFGITLPHELAGTNVLEMLDLAGIPIRSSDRADTDPLVIGGGPCVFNPEPFARFFDLILIGEGEEAIVEIIDTVSRAKERDLSRPELLEELAGIEGVYVPSLFEPRITDEGYRGTFPVHDGIDPVVVKRVVRDLENVLSPKAPIVPFMDVIHDRFPVEILRGCTRGCRFCQAGMVYRPVRERTADTVLKTAIEALTCSGYDEVALTSLSSTDHSQIEEMLRRLNVRLGSSGVSLSIPSQRLDAFGVSMARLVSSGKKTGLTFAPEAGTQRMRDIINKGVREVDLMAAFDFAIEAGWRRIKLYFMIGLPGERDEDVTGIAELANKLAIRGREIAGKGGVKISVSVATFVPKAQTPFQWDGQIDFEETMRRQTLIREGITQRGIDLSFHDAKTSFIEAVVAKGGREVATLIEDAWRRGARFDAWREHFDFDLWLESAATLGTDLAEVANRDTDPAEPLFWDHISAGISKSFLVLEREAAQEEMTTPDCSFTGCTGCDVCPTLGVDIVLACESR